MPRNKIYQLMDAVWCSNWIWEVFEVELDNLCNLKGISWRLIILESTVIWIICVRGLGHIGYTEHCVQHSSGRNTHTDTYTNTARAHTHTHTFPQTHMQCVVKKKELFA